MSNHKTAVITGAGSGVGRAIALRLVREQWRVALLGRRLQALHETVRLAGAAGSLEVLTCPCDIADPAQVKHAAQEIFSQFAQVDALVNAAGTNTPQRAWNNLTPADYERLIATNLHGAYHCIQAFLPAMRERRSGTIVNIVSDAGKLANAKAGVAYVAAKFGLAGLTQSLNAEERGNGIRACAIFPGDIDTPILDLRPTPPPPEARARMLQPEDVADCVWLALSLPARAILEELVIRPV